MKVLIVGSGGREHALAWKIARSERVTDIYCAPGNPGIESLEKGHCVHLGSEDFESQKAFISGQGIELVVIGPEAPLAAGAVDALSETGALIFGPTAAAARIESSKQFAKDFMKRHGIPTGSYEVFTDADQAIAHVQRVGAPIVIKADGLAAGKGVTVARDVPTAIEAIQQIMVEKAFGSAGASVVIEEFLEGEEASILALCDGKVALPLAPSQDHKAVFDGDAGPNTGGMGAYAPAPLVTPALMQTIQDRILDPCVAGFAAEGIPYRGVLYAGLMIGPKGPQVVEFNCRFGDPETQVVLPQLDADLVPLLEACCHGNLTGMTAPTKPGAAVSVVLASGGYPGDYKKGVEITGIAAAEAMPGVTVFHAGTAMRDGALVTNGGRVLNVTASARTVPQAINSAYEAAAKIRFEGMHYRRDIGRKALSRVG